MTFDLGPAGPIPSQNVTDNMRWKQNKKRSAVRESSRTKIYIFGTFDHSYYQTSNRIQFRKPIDLQEKFHFRNNMKNRSIIFEKLLICRIISRS